MKTAILQRAQELYELGCKVRAKHSLECRVKILERLKIEHASEGDIFLSGLELLFLWDETPSGFNASIFE